MSERKKGLKQRLKRGLRRVPVVGKRFEEETRLPVPRDHAPPSALPRPVELVLQTLVRTVGRGMADIADAVSSRVLQLDAAASELAGFVEEVTIRHGRGPVLKAVLRHNLLLNGTVLALVEPLLRGSDPGEVSIDPKHLEKGRDTIVDLLIALARLDDEDAEDNQEDDHFYGLGYLEDVGFPDRFPLVWAWLVGVPDEELDARFLMGSYFIFLQTFMLRTAARGLAEMPGMGAHGVLENKE